MTNGRRQFLIMAATGGLWTLVPGGLLGSTTRGIEAVLFDAFPIFDPRPISSLAEEVFPGRGKELDDLWHNRQFEYTWLRSLAQQYEDFWSITESALVFAARNLKLDLTDQKRDRLMQAYLELKPWPDVLPALKALAAAGVHLGFLSNFTRRMLTSCLQNSKLQENFQHILSTDDVKTYKPDPRAYKMGIDVLRLPPKKILFVAFAGWDAAGAKWFGYPTLWVNRRRQLAPEMGVSPDAESSDLSELTKFVQP